MHPFMDKCCRKEFHMELISMFKNSVLPFPKAFLAVVAMGSVLALTGCAGNPPTTQLAVANQALSAADTAGATEFAPLETRTAREKLSQAEKANLDKDYDKALRLAEQAEWDARVAERKAQAAKTQRAVKDAQQGVEELREEGRRGL